MPSPTRADLLERNIELQEREDEILNVLTDDNLDSEEKLETIADLLDDEEDDENEEED